MAEAESGPAFPVTAGDTGPLVMPQDEFDALKRVAEAAGEQPWTPEQIAGLRERFEAAMANPGPLVVLPSDHWKARAEAAEAKLLELENAITWGVSCTSCARVLDSAYAETVRREAAEARLDAVYEYCTTYRNDPGMTLACEDILAITGSEEKNP